MVTILSLSLGAVMFYGLTRDTRSQPWGHKLAIGCFVALLLIMVVQPDSGCYADWDGRSNPTVCD